MGGVTIKKVWAVFSGCVTDMHLIALYKGTRKGKEQAEARAAEENRKCPGLAAYAEEWPVEE